MFIFALSVQETVALTYDPTKLTIAATAFVTATWLAGQTLKNCGHRFLHCKEVAVSYAQELKNDDTEEILTENEIKIWSIVEGISAIPEKCWRELTATGITAVLLFIGIQSLRDKLY